MANTAGSLTPDIRPLTATSDDGKQWLLSRLVVEEAVCRPFVIQADVLHDQPGVPELLGQPMTVNYRPGLQSNRHNVRSFHGIVASITQMHGKESGNIQTFRVILRPWLELLNLRDNCRIFQTKSSKDIISALLQEHGLSGECKFNLNGTPAEREYCVQYNETDYDFINRLTREEGQHWYFQHEDGHHRLIIGDSNQSFTKCCDDLEYYRDATDLENALTRWQPQLQLQPKSGSTGSYQDEQAQTITSNAINSRHNWKTSMQLEAFRYSGHGRDRNMATDQARYWMESHDSEYLQVTGESAEPEMHAGGRFRLSRHPDRSQVRDYLLLSVKHEILNTETQKGYEYLNTFTCQPEEWPYRPKPARPVRVYGLQTAQVTGPDNSETHTDAEGRIMVRFHWDREDNPDDHSSCWLRVVQPLAGDGFGCHTLPRVGQEVLVGFLEGDPNQPVVTGCLYNGKLKIPDPSPATSGLLSRSTAEGGSDMASEIRIDDNKDKELFYLQAQKDMTTLVRNDYTRTVEANDILEVTGECTWSGKDKMTLTIDKTLDIKSTDAMTLESSADWTGKASQALSLEAGTDGKYDAKKSLKLTSPQISIEGQTSIELKVGGSKISIGPASIEISAPQVTVKGQTTAELSSVMTTVKGSGKVEVSGALASLNGQAMTEVKAGAMVQIQGAIAKIN
ncbi:type VI secretion system tip protein VgrG [Sansalvadorimonas sp. 2012CJ34-2]|uniref:Type VI secretion system tip protein VgrG n=1 Tax=Parendozoicomonas callyspongiae TaxID=2942213 RepID=A0ABT0PI85_9GAMM|nr:type VI secretion system tip protein TssI/VgrG [Sansalvadorimonas sp. 2012CJ34-2]MCL6271097.1 type VI secretion system tip protein VgrG [Sansalvadorimonas sp. 2012CJ34-2]